MKPFPECGHCNKFLAWHWNICRGKKAQDRNKTTFPDPFEGLEHEMLPANGLR